MPGENDLAERPWPEAVIPALTCPGTEFLSKWAGAMCEVGALFCLEPPRHPALGMCCVSQGISPTRSTGLRPCSTADTARNDTGTGSGNPAKG